jgi:hypothetical protein
VVVEMAGGQVDVHSHRGGRRQPTAQIRQDLPDHREVELDDEVAVLGRRHELAGVVDRPGGMCPAGQRLEGDGFPGGQVDDRLVPRDDLAVPGRPGQLGGRELSFQSQFHEPSYQVELVLDDSAELHQPSLLPNVQHPPVWVDHTDRSHDQRLPTLQRHPEVGADLTTDHSRIATEPRISSGVLDPQRTAAADHRITKSLRAGDGVVRSCRHRKG